jgi:hypothetical protein
MRLDYIFVLLVFVALFYSYGRTSAKLHNTSVKKEIIAVSTSLIVLCALLLVHLGLFFLPINIIQTSFFASCTIGYNKTPDISMKFPLHINLLTIFTGMAIGWFSARWSENMSMLNGAVGTKLIGNEKTPKGYIATKWLVFFVPMLPVRSYEVTGEQQGANERIYYSMHPLPKLEKKQINETYQKSFLWYLLIASAMIGFALLGTWKCF